MNDYVVAAFVVVWFVMFLYVAVVAMRTSRMSQEIELMSRMLDRADDERRSNPDEAPFGRSRKFALKV